MKRQLRVRRYQRGKIEVAAYTREIEVRTILYACERCNQTTFHSQLPGRKPKYCPECRQTTKREQARHRKRHQRERARAVIVK